MIINIVCDVTNILSLHSMNRILVPIDYSEASRLGLDYALEIGKLWYKNKKFVEIILFHVYNVPVVDPLGVEASGELISSFQREAEQNMSEWIKYANDNSEGIKISYDIKLGFAIPEILQYAEEEDIDLIVITNQGENSLIEKVFGSVALGIIEGTSVPVLSVPTHLEYGRIRRAFFSTNILTLDVYSLTLAVNFCKSIESSIHFFTVVDDKFPFPTVKVKRVYEELMKFLSNSTYVEELEPFYSPSYAVIETRDIINGIENYVKHHKPDMLILAKRHRTFLQSFFSKSITLEIVRDLNLPILVLPTYVKI